MELDFGATLSPELCNQCQWQANNALGVCGDRSIEGFDVHMEQERAQLDIGM